MSRTTKLPQNRTLLSVLVATSLVLVGLLLGILIMLSVRPPQGQLLPQVVADPALPPVAERPVTATDSGEVEVATDIATLNQPSREIAALVTPTVVFIEVQASSEDEGMSDWFHGFGGPHARQSVGSGVILNEEGYVVTNHHVIEGAQSIRVTLDDKRQFEAAVIGSDPSTDLAVIRLDHGDAPLSTSRFGDSDEVRVGDWVMAVGNPFRLTSTVTTGIVSALGRDVNIIEDPAGIEDFIQTDASINPGNSGGALVDLSGALIGINTAIATDTGVSEGYGFAVPANLVQRVTADLMAYGEVRRGLLGIEIRPVLASQAEDLSLDRVSGVLVHQIASGGAADLAGLESGDVILAVQDVTVDAPNALQSVVARYAPGQTLSVDVWRDARRWRFSVTLKDSNDPVYNAWRTPPRLQELEPDPALPNPREERDGEPEAPPVVSLDAWGLGLRNLDTQDQDDFGLDTGAYVLFTQNGGPAFQAGLPRDMVITYLDGEAVASAEEAQRYLEGATDATVLVRVQRRDGLTAFYELMVPQD
ncbi:MAG: trypsin-like peptidase domain-containing protein [Bacteroidota bacterium]